MTEHEVPTHVQAEDRVILWFTFPQVVAITAVCALSYGAYRYAPVGPSGVRMALAVVLALFGTAMVVGKVGGKEAAGGGRRSAQVRPRAPVLCRDPGGPGPQRAAGTACEGAGFGLGQGREQGAMAKGTVAAAAQANLPPPRLVRQAKAPAQDGPGCGPGRARKEEMGQGATARHRAEPTAPAGPGGGRWRTSGAAGGTEGARGKAARGWQGAYPAERAWPSCWTGQAQAKVAPYRGGRRPIGGGPCGHVADRPCASVRAGARGPRVRAVGP